jgi:four helix bundle protein
MGKIKGFCDLDAWQEAHRLVLMVYQVTKGFPVDERFGLVAQMRRAAISIPANVVEGFKRRGI